MIRLQQMRLDQGLTVLALSERSGVARKTITRLEDRQTGPVHPDVLKKLAEALGARSPSSLLFPAPDPEADALETVA